jgi:DNA (cytosine-5)-methyltransferase 1
MLRAIREIQPSWIVAENVCGLLTQQRGMVFGRVCTDMEADGYEVQPVVIPACAVNAPHRRERIFIVAHRADAGIESVQSGRENRVFESGTAANADSIGNNQSADNRNRQEQVRPSESAERKFTGLSGERTAFDATGRRRKQNDKNVTPEQPKQNIPDWRNFPTQSPVCNRNDGFPGRLAGITFPRWRNASIRALGNAVVPELVYEIFKIIDKIERQ